MCHFTNHTLTCSQLHKHYITPTQILLKWLIIVQRLIALLVIATQRRNSELSMSSLVMFYLCLDSNLLSHPVCLLPCPGILACLGLPLCLAVSDSVRPSFGLLSVCFEYPFVSSPGLRSLLIDPHRVYWTTLCLGLIYVCWCSTLPVFDHVSEYTLHAEPHVSHLVRSVTLTITNKHNSTCHTRPQGITKGLHLIYYTDPFRITKNTKIQIKTF